MSDKSSSQNIEVEIRALVQDIDHLKQAVVEMGASLEDIHYLHDIYFCRRDQNTLEEVEMHEVGSYSLRLRESKHEDKESTFTLNTKTITNKGNHNAWEEHETKIENFKETTNILVVTEFKPFFELEKTRFEYVLDEMNICIEDIKDFSACVEVEIITSPGHEEQAKNRIFEFLQKVGIDKSSIVPKSVTNIIMRERAFKSEIGNEGKK